MMSSDTMFNVLSNITGKLIKSGVGRVEACCCWKLDGLKSISFFNVVYSCAYLSAEDRQSVFPPRDGGVSRKSTRESSQIVLVASSPRTLLTCTPLQPSDDTMLESKCLCMPKY